MATLINYDLTTFKQAKPNKRRLQDLQHSEARSHAARVSYWRKRNLPLTKTPQQGFSDLDKGVSPGTSSTSDQDVQSLPGSTGDIFLENRHSASSGELTFVHEHGSASESPSCAVGRRKHTSSVSHRGELSVSSHHRTRSDGNTKANGRRIAKKVEESRVEHLAFTRNPDYLFFEPIDSLRDHQRGDVITALDQYLNKWAPGQKPGLRHQTKDNPLIREVFYSALQNIELFESIIALMTSFQAAGQNFENRLCNVSLYHKGRALAGIRSKLGSGLVDEAVMLSTVFLMIIDNVFAEYESYRAHLDGLRRMAMAMPRIDETRYAGVLWTFLSWAESNALLLFGDSIGSGASVDIMTATNGQPQRMPKMTPKTIAALTPGFRDIAARKQISAQLTSTLESTIRWTKCIDDQSACRTKNDEDFLARFDPRMNNARAMRLSSCHEILERAICKALYLYHANVLGWSCRCAVYQSTVLDLAAILQTNTLEDAGHQELWMWLALLTANAARRGKLEQVQNEILAKLATGAERYWSIGTVIEKFLVHSMLEREWKQCWELAMMVQST
ncbi:hypothetical protein PV08_01406 [Exophiala spinifera]|uniref:Uncharacterized protein n=1 Tax=Exophiala spinifera TaxID=91928 RepID=A0A0D2BPG0_9EURO|nr:uncharacterized protein PV08_01406 [Exophiala spinifera]KIW20828.1 hypothetical protein PV08_01406 [Exophiala spinifera]